MVKRNINNGAGHCRRSILILRFSLGRFAGFYYCLHHDFSAACKPEILLKVSYSRDRCKETLLVERLIMIDRGHSENDGLYPEPIEVSDDVRPKQARAAAIVRRGYQWPQLRRDRRTVRPRLRQSRPVPARHA